MSGNIIEARGLTKHYPVRGGMFEKPGVLKAVDGVDFTLAKDKVFGIVGESGCGKSTIAKLVLRLIEPTAGGVYFNGTDIAGLRGADLMAFRRAVQIVFQDPFASLNPRRTVYQTLSEPMKIHRLSGGSEIKDRVVSLLGRVGMRDVLDRYPHEFSGGQRQRICIARALSVEPEVIVADEPLSALDVSIQAQIVNLLMELKAESRLSYIFISHDLRVVEYLSDHVAVMYLGRVVEQAPAEALFGEPRHPYTKMLLMSAPTIKPGGRKPAPLQGEVPSPVDTPPGCPFHPRCPERFGPCSTVVPALVTLDGAKTACHLYTK